MAFAYTNNSRPLVIGNARMRTGTFTNASGDTGGAIVTGLNGIFACNVWCTSHVNGGAPKFTVSAGTITILNNDNIDGGWFAIGV